MVSYQMFAFPPGTDPEFKSRPTGPLLPTWVIKVLQAAQHFNMPEQQLDFHALVPLLLSVWIPLVLMYKIISLKKPSFLNYGFKQTLKPAAIAAYFLVSPIAPPSSNIGVDRLVVCSQLSARFGFLIRARQKDRETGSEGRTRKERDSDENGSLEARVEQCHR